MTIDWSKVLIKEIEDNLDNLYEIVTEENVDKLIEKFPKKVK